MKYKKDGVSSVDHHSQRSNSKSYDGKNKIQLFITNGASISPHEYKYRVTSSSRASSLSGRKVQKAHRKPNFFCRTARQSHSRVPSFDFKSQTGLNSSHKKPSIQSTMLSLLKPRSTPGSTDELFESGPFQVSQNSQMLLSNNASIATGHGNQFGDEIPITKSQFQLLNSQSRLASRKQSYLAEAFNYNGGTNKRLKPPTLN